MNRTSLMLSLSLSAVLGGTSSAAVTLVAEYHLGESGSLSGSSQNPQDAAGSRHFASEINGSSATVGTTGVVAPGSTAYLDTSSGVNEGWYGADFSTLPTDDFAFGIYARAVNNSGSEQGDVFTLGGDNGAFKLSLAGNGWAASAHNVAWIGQANGVSGSFTSSIWVHLALIRSGGVTTFYIDGVAQGTYSGAPAHGSSHLSVSPGGASYFDGQLDEGRVVTFTAGESTANILGALTAVPEPSTLLLGGLGAFALLGRRKRA
jgi:hypothetical protein